MTGRRPVGVTVPPVSKTVLIISQVYVPDPAAVGQHLHEVARELARRGHRVHVIASARGHHDPGARYPARERIEGVEVERVPLGNLGKGSIGQRLAGSGLFLGQALPRALRLAPVDHVLVSTSPPPAPPVGALAAAALRARFTLWMMDINPDQAVASAGLDPRSKKVRAFEFAIRQALGRADLVVTLDRFMAERLDRKHPIRSKTEIIPPWPLEELGGPIAHADNPFRTEHGLGGKRVVMYSGNISATHPVATVLEGLRACPDRDRLELVFIGSGTGLPAVERFMRENPDLPVRHLPYQPLERVRYSLSAADAHLVSIGDDQVGIVHPCKVYGVMAMARPFVYLGPAESHVADIAREHGVGFQLRHGDVEGAAALLSQLARMPQPELDRMGTHCAEVLEAHYSRNRWLARFCDVLTGTSA